MLVFRNEQLNEMNQRVFEQMHVGAKLKISNKILKGLEDGSAALGALLRLFLVLKEALIGRPAKKKSTPLRAKDALNDAYRLQNRELDLKAFGKRKMTDDAYLLRVWRWLRRNRVRGSK